MMLMFREQRSFLVHPPAEVLESRSARFGMIAYTIHPLWGEYITFVEMFRWMPSWSRLGLVKFPKRTSRTSMTVACIVLATVPTEQSL